MLRLCIVLCFIFVALGNEVKLALKQRNLDKLEEILYQVSDPNHKNYGKHLSVEQLRSLIGSDPADIEAIRQWVEHDLGVHDLEILPSGDVLKFEVSLDTAQLIFQDKKYHTNIVLPYSLHGIIDAVLISGYDYGSISSSQSGRQRVIKSKSRLLGDAAPNIQKQFYQVPLTATGSNSRNLQMVWGPGTYGVSLDDVSDFYQQFNINAQTSAIQIPQFQGTPGGDNWGEGTLDAEYISAFATGVTTLVVNSNTSMSTEEGLGFGYAFLDELLALAQVSDGQIPYVISLSLGSLSWSSCNMMCNLLAAEGQFTYQDCVNYMQTQRQVCMYDSLQQTARMHVELLRLGTRGVSIFAATGDGGSHFSFEPFPSSPIGDALNVISCKYNFPTFPASSPYVTGVGGIDITDINNPVAWSGSGSGFSWEFSMPSYQQAVVTHYLNASESTPNFPSPGSFNPKNRAYPDVSAVSIDTPIVIGGEVVETGGTSASTPTFAGLISLINDARLNKGLPPLGFLNPVLYQIVQAHPGEAFLDITSGNSQTSCTEGFPATVGWDPVTGLGSPIYPGLFKYLTN